MSLKIAFLAVWLCMSVGAFGAEASKLNADFAKLEKADGEAAENLDIKIGKTITESPREFLTALKAHRSKVKRLDALLGNLGPDFVDRFDAQIKALEARVAALKTVADAGLSGVRHECIAELKKSIESRRPAGEVTSKK